MCPLRLRRFPLLVLIVSLAGTGVVWYGLKTQAEANAAADFENDTRQISETVGARMRAYEDALQSVVALFAASEAVTRDDWRRFVDRLELRRDYPGIEVLGFAKHLGMQQRAGHERDMRAQGLPEYRVWPEGSRDEYMAVTFIEPFSGQTRRVLGYDMLANPTSRSAMERARDTGAVSLSGRWTVVQDTVPTLKRRYSCSRLSIRRESSPTVMADDSALVGYVYAALRCDDLMADILRNSVVDIGLAVYDGNRAPAGSLLYAERAGAGCPR